MADILLTSVLLLLVIASIIDLKTREIPDWISVLLVLAAIAAAATGTAGVEWWMVVSGAALGLAIGYVLFRFAKFGGGDAKLIIALGALLGPVGLIFLLFWMAIAGGALALIALARGQSDYAYGPAIAAGYLAYLVWPIGLLSRLAS